MIIKIVKVVLKVEKIWIFEGEMLPIIFGRYLKIKILFTLCKKGVYY